jgi:hypothetical protein
MHENIIDQAWEVFAADVATIPPMTLRGGNAVDSFDLPAPFDPEADQPADDYLEAHYRGIVHLDPASWRHYLPRLIDYALQHLGEAGAAVTEALLWSFRPPDREPPRLGSLTPQQEAVVVAFLEAMAFTDASAYQDLATQVLEEYWIPGALYRETKGT